MSTGVKVIWKCSIPRDKTVKALCEASLIQTAKNNGMDTAVVRAGPHSTTRIAGKYVRTVPHITGDIVNTKVNKGYAVHLNLDSSQTNLLKDNPPTSPNPEMWDLIHKANKGFVLVD